MATEEHAPSENIEDVPEAVGVPDGTESRQVLRRNWRSHWYRIVPVALFFCALLFVAWFASFMFPATHAPKIQIYVLALSVYASFAGGLIAFLGSLYHLASGKVRWDPPLPFAFHMVLNIAPGVIAILLLADWSCSLTCSAPSTGVAPESRPEEALSLETKLEVLAVVIAGTYLGADLLGKYAADNRDHQILSRIGFAVIGVHLLMLGVSHWGDTIPILRDYYPQDDGKAVHAFAAGGIGLMLLLQNVAFAFYTNIFKPEAISEPAVKPVGK